MLTVFITYPKRICQVDHIQPPAISFFIHKNYLRLAKSLE